MERFSHVKAKPLHEAQIALQAGPDTSRDAFCGCRSPVPLDGPETAEL